MEREDTITKTKPIKVGTRVYVLDMTHYCYAGSIKSIEPESYIADFHYNIELDDGQIIECESYGINGKYGFHRQLSVFTDKNILNNLYKKAISELKEQVKVYEKKIETLKSL